MAPVQELATAKPTPDLPGKAAENARHVEQIHGGFHMKLMRLVTYKVDLPLLVAGDKQSPP